MQGRAAAERIVRTLENDARIAGARVENLAKVLDTQKTVVWAPPTRTMCGFAISAHGAFV